MQKLLMFLLMVGFAGQMVCADEFDDLVSYKYSADNKEGSGGAAEKAFEKLTALKAEEKSAIEQKLIAVISSKDTTEDGKAWACRFLQIIGTDASVPALGSLLGDEVLSHYARLALERMEKSDAAAKALREALEKVSAKLQAGIAVSLGQMGDIEAVEALGTLAKKGDSATAAAALMALGKIADSKASKILLDIKAGPESKKAYYDALVECASRTGGKEAVSMYEMLVASDSDAHRSAGLVGLCMADIDKGSGVLETALKGEDQVLIDAALSALVEVKGEKLTSKAVSILDNAGPAMQAKIITVLGVRGDKAALKGVTGSLKSEDKSVREAALVSVALLGDAGTVRMLLTMEGLDKDIAGSVIVRMTDPAVNSALIAALDDSKTRMLAIEGIKARNCTEAVPALMELTKCNDADFRKAVWGTIGKLTGEKEFAGLVLAVKAIQNKDELQYGVDAIRDALGPIDDKAKAFTQLAEAYDNGDDVLKKAILELGNTVGTPEALALERKGLNSGNADLAKAAVKSMAAWPNQGPAGDLLDVAKTSNDEVLQILALRGYLAMAGSEMKIKPQDRVTMFRNAQVLIKDANEKRMLIGGQRMVQNNQALTILCDYLDDDSLRNDIEAAGIDILSKWKEHTAESEKIVKFLLNSVKKQNKKFAEDKLKEWGKTEKQ